jgi:uncharacterized protein (DUF433 family)
MSLAITSDLVPLHADDSGTLRVGSSRVSLDSIIYGFLQGAAAEEIAYQYPTVDLADVYAVIGFYLRHREDVDEYLTQRKNRSDELQRECEVHSPPTGLRERLLERRGRQVK